MINDKSNSTDIAQHIYGMGEPPRAMHIEAQRFTRLDLENGTLARCTPKDRRLPFWLPLAALAGLALGVMLWR